MVKIYTKTGDDGNTGLLGNVRVGKESKRIETIGAVDETNAAIGVLLAHLPPAASEMRPHLNGIQSDLLIIGSILSTPPSDPKTRADISPSRLKALEDQIDRMEEDLPPLQQFILPQGNACASFAHLGRAICRRAERRVVELSRDERLDKQVLVYLNRLSDFLFVLARWINAMEGGPETLWSYNRDEGAKTTTGTARPADRLGTTLKKLETEKENRKTLFEKTSSQMQKKKDIADKLFRQNIDQINKEGGKVEKPLRDFDLE
jgi:cob(I)alamin adenosyltransferase